LKFCPKCGTRLVPATASKSVVLKCQKCEYTTRASDIRFQALQQGKEKIVVIGDKLKDINPLPKAKTHCTKCGHNEAFYWMVQTRSADESSTQFFRCTRCGNTWRENA